MRSMRLHFQKGDIIAVVTVLVMAVMVSAMFLPDRDAAAYAEIYQNGEYMQTVSLDTPQEFTVTFRYRNTIAVQDGKIAIIESDCPGEDCVHSGWINGSGRSIVCLPNELEIRVIAEPEDVDYVVG